MFPRRKDLVLKFECQFGFFFNFSPFSSNFGCACSKLKTFLHFWVTYHMSCFTCHVSHVMWHMLCVICHVSHAMCHMPCVTCHVSHVMCQISCVTCHVSHFMGNMSHVTCYMSHITCHILYVIFSSFFFTFF